MTFVSRLQKVALDSTEKIINWIIVGILITIIALTQIQGMFRSASNFFTHKSATTHDVVNVIIGSPENKSELTTVILTTKATVKSAKKRILIKWSVGDTNLVYEAVGKVQAAVDISKLQVKEVDGKKSKVHILLPPPHFTDTTLDIGRSSVVDYYGRWISPNAGPELEENAQKEALRKIAAEACSNKLLEVANENAKQLVEKLLKQAEYKQVIVETQAPQADSCKDMGVSN